jgi:RNA polymerase sigma-70 factor (ECF subfamily)
MPSPSLQMGTDASEDLAGLLADVASGSRSAFEALYRATSGKVFGICVRLIADRSEAEDVLQEVYTSVWHRAAQFDAARASALTWLGSIARHKAIDRLRALPAPQRVASIELADEIADPSASPLQHTEAMTERERLEGCMEQLDARGRTLIRTAFFEGATYEQLATRSGSPLGSVKSWIRRGLMQLRTCLER